MSTAKKPTPAQERMLRDLWPAADNAERMWYFGTARARKTLVCLEDLRLVELLRDGFTIGARLTRAGLLHLGVENV